MPLKSDSTSTTRLFLNDPEVTMNIGSGRAHPSLIAVDCRCLLPLIPDAVPVAEPASAPVAVS